MVSHMYMPALVCAAIALYFWRQDVATASGLAPCQSPGEDSGANSPLPCRFFVQTRASTEAIHRVRTNSLRPKTTETIAILFVTGLLRRPAKYEVKDASRRACHVGAPDTRALPWRCDPPRGRTRVKPIVISPGIHTTLSGCDGGENLFQGLS